MDISPQQHRQAFAGWLRSGRWRIPPSIDDPGFKFNPNHDPANGRFTSGGGSGGGGGASGGFHGGAGSFGGAGASGSWASPIMRRRVSVAKPAVASRAAAATPRAAVAKPSAPAGSQPATPAASELRRVVSNGYEYLIDAEGRTRQVSGELREKRPVGPRSRRAQREAGGADRRPTDHGGHFIAPRFDGPTDAFNHFGQNANFNTGPYRVLEDRWAKEVRRGNRVKVTITASYEGESRRPSELVVSYRIGDLSSTRRFRNEHQGKSNETC